jgi:uncharacterized protein (TIGR02231 family)
MKHHVNFFWITCFAFIFWINPGQSGAATREVTLFPASAQVVETARLKIIREGNLNKTIFLLPAQADPDSLITRVQPGGKLRIIDQTWRQTTRLDEDRVNGLRKKIDALKSERNQMRASIHALETQIQFWQLQTKAKVKSTADAGNFATAIGKNIKKAYQDKLAQDPEFEKLIKRIKELEEELNQAVGKKDTLWEITLLLAGPPSAADIAVTYAYNLSGCGWAPLYRLEGKPRDNQILFTWEAEIWQSSGQDWSDVVMNLATLQPVTTIIPQDLPLWIIKPRPAVIFSKAARKSLKTEAAAASLESTDQAAEAEPAAASAPQEVRQTTYSVWQLGKISLPAGARQRVKVQEESWTADFAYLIRPSLSGKAFVRAEMKAKLGVHQLAAARDIPSGQAVFMIDGAILGKRPFSMAGKEADIFFGEDSFVSAKVDLLTRQSGEKTFLADTQTHKWEWRIDVENRRKEAVRVRIEEPFPQSRDERIKLTLRNDPEVSEQNTTTLIWNLEVPAGQKKSILSSVHLEAPRKMIVDLGWRK